MSDDQGQTNRRAGKHGAPRMHGGPGGYGDGHGDGHGTAIGTAMGTAIGTASG